MPVQSLKSSLPDLFQGHYLRTFHNRSFDEHHSWQSKRLWTRKNAVSDVDLCQQAWRLLVNIRDKREDKRHLQRFSMFK